VISRLSFHNMGSEDKTNNNKIKPEQQIPCEIAVMFVQIWGIYRNV
jgi:hypothetical protein